MPTPTLVYGRKELQLTCHRREIYYILTMIYRPYRIRIAHATRRKVALLVSLFLLVNLSLQILPFTSTPDGRPLPAGQESASAYFEPLQVCDDGTDVNGFLADTPWLPSDDLLFITGPECTACAPPPALNLAEGYSPDLFRPPRIVLS